MVTNELSKKIKFFILKILNDQFMYPDEIIENAIQKYSSIWGSDKIIKNF